MPVYLQFIVTATAAYLQMFYLTKNDRTYVIKINENFFSECFFFFSQRIFYNSGGGGGHFLWKHV